MSDGNDVCIQDVFWIKNDIVRVRECARVRVLVPVRECVLVRVFEWCRSEKESGSEPVSKSYELGISNPGFSEACV